MSLKNYTASTVLNYTPQKARLVLNIIRGMVLSQALEQLAHNSRPKSKKIYHLLLSAASNLSLVETEYDKFKVDSIFAEEAQRLYRSIPRARGTAHRIARRYSRIKVTLAAI
ncbi:MAG: uL22 family ribosomal protein [Candidatus Parcubacteria bacterium]|nr:uL22 family ribosomal protein [Candidatus Paceibacterota bacterium]